VKQKSRRSIGLREDRLPPDRPANEPAPSVSYRDFPSVRSWTYVLVVDDIHLRRHRPPTSGG
jgi:hypothetical protein